MRYASRTSVSVERSRAEIEKTLNRYKADQFATAVDHAALRVAIQFRLNGLVIRFEMAVPKDEQGQRQRWRALSLAIKAKLEAVECNITTFEEEFLSHIVMPTGSEFGATIIPQIRKAVESGVMPQSLIEWSPHAKER